uniref:Uncharacterized protein n=1 Tax=Oryza sativa subsp. japonica TaxID=39947 RepID=Q33BB0_ORYSJ|nr:hypothetical protein LOC_Os10g03590 [Oryza sativa Japonica Group]
MARREKTTAVATQRAVRGRRQGAHRRVGNDVGNEGWTMKEAQARAMALPSAPSSTGATQPRPLPLGAD